VARFRDDPLRARHLYEQSLALDRETDNPWGVACTYLNLAQVALSLGDPEAAAPLAGEGLRTFYARREGREVAYALLAMAGVAVGQGRPARGARLLGATMALLEELATPLMVVDRKCYERDVAAARAVLTEEAFNAAWAEGRRMAMDEAVAYALEETKSV
jgi:non-specific serine/threonine protein kinase